jgi:hypothetical protein
VRGGVWSLNKEHFRVQILFQFDNTANRKAHYVGTGPEIWQQTNGTVTAFTCATGTGGTLAGTGMFLKEKNPKIKVASGGGKKSATCTTLSHSTPLHPCTRSTWQIHRAASCTISSRRASWTGGPAAPLPKVCSGTRAVCGPPLTPFSLQPPTQRHRPGPRDRELERRAD